MFSFLSFLIKEIFNLTVSKRQLIIRIILLEKEVEIYRIELLLYFTATIFFLIIPVTHDVHPKRNEYKHLN